MIGKYIGILTLHSALNEGAILQSYCLSKHLLGQLPYYKTEIVDHSYPLKLKTYGSAKTARKKAMESFIKKSLPLSDQSFVSKNLTSTFKYIQNRYGALIVGSDEVWKLHYQRRFGLLLRQDDPWHVPFPNVYWPNKIIRIPKIAYAACIGQTNWILIPCRHKKIMRDCLSDFRLIGVRDKRTIYFLDWLDPALASRAEWVPDPTFSFDFLSTVDIVALKMKLVDAGVDFSRPRCLLAMPDSDFSRLISNSFKSKGYQIISLTFSNQFADIDLTKYSFDPLEWARIFGLVDICATVRMHGCIASLLNKTPFVAIDLSKRSEDDESKIQDLMSRCGLLNFYFHPKLSNKRLIGICDELLNGPWPRDDVSDMIRMFKHRSDEFAQNIIKVID